MGALFLLDATQSLGQVPVDVNEAQCDFLTGTGRKWLRGMRGTGLLYVRGGLEDRLVDPVFIDGNAAEWVSQSSYKLRDGAARYEVGEISVAGKLGLITAIEYAIEIGVDRIAKRVGWLAGELREALGAIEGITVLDQGVARSGIVTFVSERLSTSETKQLLRSRGINVAAPTINASRLDLELRGVESIVRASIHYYNTTGEIGQVASTLSELSGSQ